MDYGSFIKDERKRQRLTVAELARRSDLASSTISNWENAGFVPTLDKYEQVMKALGKRIVVIDIDGEEKQLHDLLADAIQLEQERLNTHLKKVGYTRPDELRRSVEVVAKTAYELQASDPTLSVGWAIDFMGVVENSDTWLAWAERESKKEAMNVHASRTVDDGESNNP